MKLNTAPYPVQLEVVFDWTNFSKKYKKAKGIEPEEQSEGVTTLLPDGSVLIYAQDSNPITLVHELNHFCIYTFGFIGLPINDESSEAYCYYMDSLLKQVLKHER